MKNLWPILIVKLYFFDVKETRMLTTTTYFLEEFTYISLPLEKKSLSSDNKKIYFPNLFPETELTKSLSP